jgi:hypothetical protein
VKVNIGIAALLCSWIVKNFVLLDNTISYFTETRKNSMQGGFINLLSSVMGEEGRTGLDKVISGSTFFLCALADTYSSIIEERI